MAALARAQGVRVDVDALVLFVRDELHARADRRKAGPMAAYMKTRMPFFGVQKPDRAPVFKSMVRRFPAASQTDYRKAVLALWNGTHREEKYAAIHYATAHPAFIGLASLALYKRMIREGAWWDFVDDLAIRLAGRVWLAHRTAVNPIMDTWSTHRDLWLRRSAIIGQIKHKAATDEARLFRYARTRAHETEFFIRKAIGWALREHSKTRPAAVERFLVDHRKQLSGLSFREGAKALVRAGRMRA